MKRFISVIIVAIMLVSLCIVSVSATTAPVGDIGDANFDGEIDVSDATFILRALAKLESPDEVQMLFGDTDKDGLLSVIDATNIQRYEAKIEPNGYVGRSYNYDMIENDFYSDYESGMAMAGVPVTFTANAVTGSPVKSYELYVDKVCVASSETNSITYTFEKAGVYDVCIQINAYFSTGYIGESEFEVVEPYESETPLFKTLYLTGKIQWETITYGVNGMKVHADAIGGVGPYQYKFMFERPESGAQNAPIWTYTQDYSENNVFELPVIGYSEICSEYPTNIDCNLTVYIKDANEKTVSRDMPIHYTWDYPIG